MFTVSVFPIYTRNFKDTIKANGHSYSVEAQDMWTYINKNIPDDKTFIFRSARELYLYTKHLTVTPDQKADFYLHNFESVFLLLVAVHHHVFAAQFLLQLTFHFVDVCTILQFQFQR